MTITTVANRAALSALSSPSGQVAFLTEDGREGNFEFRSGDYSALVAADMLQGLYVASSSIPASSGCWVRVWDEVNGRPEWFGAAPNSGTSDCLPALNACLALCPVTLLSSKDYWISETWIIETAYRTVKSEVNSDQYATGNGCRIVCTNPSRDVVQVGPTSQPSSVNTFPRNIRVEGIAAVHSVAVNPPGGGQTYNGVAGFRVQYVLLFEGRNLLSAENIIGFRLYGVVASRFVRCRAFRSMDSAPGNPDLFYGWYLQGSPAILAGGNASVYIENCSVELGNNPALPAGSIGLFADGAFVDTFIDDFETSQTRVGIVFNGNDWNGTSLNTEIDVLIRNPVLDQCSEMGIQIVNTNRSCQIEVTNPYVATKTDATAGIYVNQAGGQVRIQGGRIIGSGDSTGLFISQSSGVEVDGCAVSNFGRIGCYVEYSDNFRVSASVNNQNSVATHAAFYVRDSERGTIEPNVKGMANAFPQGVYLLGTNNSSITIDPTCINSDSISGGAANKVQVNGNQLTLPGYYTSSGGSGTAGQGITLVGITK